MKAQGIIGVAFNLQFHGTCHYLGAEALIARLVDLDFFLQIQIQEQQLVDFLPVIAGSPVRLLIDHCGRPDPAAGLSQPGFQALLRLGREGRAAPLGEPLPPLRMRFV